jgi:predicted ATPase/DNA-binding CsgD family transcriptional regulator/transcriptional regulator with XRE-family HTH domain
MGEEASRGLFGVLLRAHREAAGLTQEDLAERAGLTAKGISALERGERRRPYPQTVRAIADALALSPEDRGQLIASVDRQARVEPVATGREASSLPTYSTRLVGRDDEVRLVVDQLTHPDVRLLTLVGPGGVGKTRLAVAAAEAIAERGHVDQVWFCDLSTLHSPSDVLFALARSIQVAFTVGGDPLAAIARHLGDRRSLLVVDNFEHVLDAASDLGRLMGSTRVTVLATSREPLRLRWERVLIVQPLALPDLRHLPSADDLAAVAAIALFVQRARAATTGFALNADNAQSVAALCGRLDGLPLAIELVASRAAQFGAAATLERLERRLSIGEIGLRDMPDRHRSLRAAFEWSLDLLPAEERDLFARLGVFVGGWEVEAAQAIAGDAVADVMSALWSLVDKNLVLLAPATDGGRFAMLDTAREVARDLLADREDKDDLRAAHARYFAETAEAAASRLGGASQASAVLALEREEDNFRAALDWAAGEGGPAAIEVGLRLSGALGWYWFLHGYPPEAKVWFDALVGQADDPGEADDDLAALRAKALNAAGFRATDQGEYELAARAHRRALATWRRQDVVPGLVASLHGVGDTSLWLGDVEPARAAYVEGLEIARARGTGEDIALFEFHLGQLAWLTEDIDAAESHASTALEVALAAGSRTWPRYALFILASAAHERRDVGTAGPRYREALRLAWEHRDRLCVRMALPGLAALATLEGDPARAVRLTAGATALETSAGIWAFPPIRARHERWLTDARAALDEATERDAWAEGTAMTLDEVIEDALAVPRLPRSLPRAGSVRVRLSEREREVLDLVAAGYSNPQIAERLVVTSHTAKYHVTSLLNKLGANNRAEAVARAAGLGLIEVPAK